MKDNRKAGRARKQYKRTTLCVDPELYRDFKIHAARQGVSVTSLVTKMMTDVLEQKTEDTDI